MLADLINCTKDYRLGYRKSVRVLDSITWSIPEGSLLGLIGPNGSGKSTSIKILLGLLRPTEGSVRLFGNLPAPNAMSRIGYVMENVAFADHLRPSEILDYVAQQHRIPSPIRKNRIDHLLEEVLLASHRSKLVRQFSKGMVQRLAIAAALLPDPQLLILDEPMSGLDPLGRRFMIDLLARQHRLGKTICFSSHILNDVDELCDRIVIIYNGKILFQGNKSELVNQNNAYRLTFAMPQPPEWLHQAKRLGPDTWYVTQPEHEIYETLSRLRKENAHIIGLVAQREAIEESFFRLIGK